MIVEEHVQSYINSLNKEEDSFILQLEKEAHEHHVPIIRSETRELLRFLVRMKKPARILEIGTAIGYSAIVMHKCQGQDGKLDTIERNEKRYNSACANIEKAGFSESIQIHFGDALDVLEQLKESYDFIFMDAAKAQYENFLERCMGRLDREGILVCDNILQDGSVAQSRYAVTRRDHTVHDRMREFLYNLKRKETLDTVILPVGDGVAISRKK